ncbi:radical SAM protein [Pseudomonas sp. W5-36]|uniref:radical SAM protein n=1 Tax=Pseudomonas sp. W5-36 TaxID=3097455 RepID=UPI00397C951D
MRARYLPNSLSLYITYNCFLKCPHCFLVQKGEINRYELPFDTVSELINEAEAYGVFTVIIAGGDPLLHPDFLKIVKLIKSKNIVPLVASTGINLKDEMIKDIKCAGIPTLQLSLDGASPHTHDAIRRSGNFIEVCGAAKRIVASGLNLNIALCIHKANAREVVRLFLLCQRLEAFSVKLSFYVEFLPTPNCAELNPQEISWVLQQARDFAREHERTDWIICPGYDISSGTQLNSVISSPSVVISADGGVSIDEGAPRFGNVYSGSLAEIYTLHANDLIRNFFKQKLSALSSDYAISSIEVSSSGLHANALVYSHESKFHIIIDDCLSEVTQFFTALHEIGHIATETLKFDPRSVYDQEMEFLANEWALSQIKPNIHPEVLYQYENALFDSETALYRLIDKNLARDLVNFF